MAERLAREEPSDDDLATGRTSREVRPGLASPSVASVVPGSLPPSPAEEESYPLSPPEVISDVYGGAREAALNAIDLFFFYFSACSVFYS